MELERRFAPATVEGRQLVGLAAPYGVETRMGEFSEVIAQGAFRRTLGEGRDILALADHDPAKVLGRTRSGSLVLNEERDGLHFALTLPDTTTGRDLRALAERGDLGGVSFGFHAVKDSWDAGCRTLEDVELIEVSIVQAFPAYPDTTVALRSKPKTFQCFFVGGSRWLETVR